MSVSENITHPGIVEKVTGDKAFIKILAMSACSSCHAKGMCNVAEVEEKVVEIRKDPRRTLRIGEQVTVTMKKSQGTYAVLLGYVVPFFILIGVLMLVLFLSGDEGLAGLSAVLILIPYYGILYFYRKRLKSIFTFMIE